MKINRIALSFFAVSAMMLASCSEGKYWDEPSDAGQVYAFPKPVETVSVPADGTIPSCYDVTITRNNNGGEVTVPVSFTSNSPLLTGASSVTFAAGSSSAVYKINIAEGVKAGLSYTAKLVLTEDENTLIHVDSKNLSYSFNLSQVLVLKWESRGIAATISAKWVGNEDLIDIPVEEAVNHPIEGQRLMRLVSPYWYLEPEVAQQGANIEFYLDEDGNAQSMAATWQFMGETDPDYGYFFFGCPANYGGYFANEENVFVMSGVVGYASSISGSGLTPAWYETLQFIWSDYGK